MAIDTGIVGTVSKADVDRPVQDQAFLPEHDLNTPDDVRRLQLDAIQVQRARVNRALSAERRHCGNVLDRATSTEMRRLNSMISAYYQFYEPETEKSPKNTTHIQQMLAKVFDKPHRGKRTPPKAKVQTASDSEREPQTVSCPALS